MSEAASVPFSETKAPESPDRLHRGALSLIDISASTMANIGPAYSFYFGFAFLVATAGVAAPLTIIAAGVAIPAVTTMKAKLKKKLYAGPMFAIVDAEMSIRLSAPRFNRSGDSGALVSVNGTLMCYSLRGKKKMKSC